MRNLKSHSILKLLNFNVIHAPQPSNLSYLWNFGSLLLCCLIIQIAIKVNLAMHYNGNVLEAINSIEHIMRDVNNGWLIRYFQDYAQGALFFFLCLYIGIKIYYGLYIIYTKFGLWTYNVILVSYRPCILISILCYYYGSTILITWGNYDLNLGVLPLPFLSSFFIYFFSEHFYLTTLRLNRYYKKLYTKYFTLCYYFIYFVVWVYIYVKSNFWFIYM